MVASMEIIISPSLYERMKQEAVTRLFVSYEAISPLNAERIEQLRKLFDLAGVLPVLIGAPSTVELRAVLALEGVLYAGRHGGEFHEPDEDPDRLENHLRLSRTDPPALRRALTGWVLANRSPADAFAVYVGCAALDLPAMQLIEQAGGLAVFSGGDCLPTDREITSRMAVYPLTP
jgi:hypothetical protein